MGQVLVRVGVKHCKQGKGHKHKSLVHRSHHRRFRPLLMKVGGDNNVYHRLELIVKIYYHRWLVFLIDGDCNTPGVCHSLSSGFELKHDRLSGDDDGKVNLWR
jgi:hypothetical protein